MKTPKQVIECDDFSATIVSKERAVESCQLFSVFKFASISLEIFPSISAVLDSIKSTLHVDKK